MMNIKILEKDQNQEAKITAQKQQTLDKVEDIIKSHKGLQKQYEDEIKKNEILLELAKEQDKQQYILQSIKNYQNAKLKAQQELITGLPHWENEYDIIHNKINL